jgi:molybdate transport system substrate-binding protein
MSRRMSVFAVLLSLELLIVACSSSAVQPTSAPTAIPQPTTALAAATAAMTGGTTLTVFAAASLTDSFKAIGSAFETAHPGVKVTFSFAGSQQLRAQIEQGAKADVFASADTKNMDPLKTENLLGRDPQVFTQNALTVIVPKANPAGLKTLQDLTKPGLKLVFEDASVPAGNYTLQILDKLSADPTYGSVFKTKVLANVVSKETDVKAVVSKVSLGEGDAGVVYTTDAEVAADKLSTIAIPDEYNVVANYPIAILKAAPNPALAQQFVDFVLSSDGQSILTKYGFVSR